ncbi:DUF6264 family protein [Curtobacterium sp. Leaf261]|uniref:DUF6264 family protein n=1 Tax=Curtobacterium sp. Leaf261 TaxID=1736311 RepID=UPI00070017A6|nr:DUF6264 family protein [Curtobacterium sp. Leaf261]KQO63404.1 hypothetical protein ASF23_03840 [Curtobacterium sp. Leaf261]
MTGPQQPGQGPHQPGQGPDQSGRHPGSGPLRPASWETATDREARVAWEQGGTSLLPSGRRFADRVITVVLLAAGALLTIIVGIITVIALLVQVAACDSSIGCSPGGMLGGAAIIVGGSFVVGVATIVTVIGVWIRRRPTWWIATLGLVLTLACIVGGGIVYSAASETARSGQVTIQPYPLPGS